MKFVRLSPRVLCVGLLVGGGGLCAVPGRAQDENSKQQTSVTAAEVGIAAGKLTEAEVNFVKAAGAANLAEAKLGELAQGKSTNPDVKTLGQTMSADHTKANADLRAVAGKAGVLFEPRINTRDEAAYERLSKFSGAEFDKAYLANTVADHTRDVTDYDQEIKDGKDDDLRKYAAETLPVIQRHLQAARDMENGSGQGAKQP